MTAQDVKLPGPGEMAPALARDPAEVRRSRRELIMRLVPVIMLVAIYVIFAIAIEVKTSLSGVGLRNAFLTLDNVSRIATQTTMVGIAGLGMTLVIILGGIDLSVGSLVALTSVVIAALLGKEVGAGAGPFTAAMAGILVGAAAGLAIGVFVTRLKVVPFIVTLGMMLVLRGAAKMISGEQKIDAVPKGLMGLLAAPTGAGRWIIVPPGVWIMIVLAVGTWILLDYTRFGRHVVAIGSNEQTARLCGVPVERVKILVYTICGLAAGITGLMQFSRLSVGDPTTAVGMELNVIAAVVIGGGSFSGGEGSILGTIVGAFIMSVIRAGCTQLDIPNYWQEIVTGVILIAAVWFDQFRRRRAE